MMIRRSTLVLALCALVLFACSPAPAAPATLTRVSPLPTIQSTAVPTRSPAGAQTTPTEMPPTGEPSATLVPTSPAPPRALADDFSNPRSGWDISSGKEGSVGYKNGEYVIQVDEADYSLWANPGQAFGDVLVGARAQLADGRLPADMGVICRYQDTGNFIYGEVTSDGFYSISQVKQGDLKVLTGGGNLQRHAAIRNGAEANQIQLLCAGSRFTLLVNDQVVAGIEADAPSSGDVGLIAGTFEKSGAQVHFDDFSAVSPPPNTAAGDAQPGRHVLFSDDFSDPNSGWEVRQTDNGASGYRAGRYFIRVDTPKYQLWSSPGQSFEGSIVAEVTARAARGSVENEMGVICRYQDRKNFIYGSISTAGYYSIVEIKDDETKVLTGNGKFQKSAAIPAGSEAYDIRLVCGRDSYTLFVNGEEIDSASSQAFSGGDVGLLAGSFDQGRAEVLFDDFSVSTP